MLNFGIHKLRHTMATEPRFFPADQRPDGGDSFWVRDLVFISETGEVQRVTLFAETREALEVIPFSADKAYGPPTPAPEPADLSPPFVAAGAAL